MRTPGPIIERDSHWFIARSLDVPVTTQDGTLAAVRKNRREAVELYIETWGPSKELKS
jgi:hypothetical protein